MGVPEGLLTLSGEIASTISVLKKMTLTIPGIRERVISHQSYAGLEEMLRFRHFKRYYFEFDYDWDRLELVRAKFISVRNQLIEELSQYRVYLSDLSDQLTP